MDGRTDGPELIQRVNREITKALTLANLIGAIVVFVFLIVVLPARHQPPLGKVILLTVPAGVAYLVFTSFAGPKWGRALARPRNAWLQEGRVPTEGEQRLTLRLPVRQLVVPAGLWGAGAVIFGLINLYFSAEIAGRAFTTIVMGGLTACAVSYLVVERLTRPIAARALEAGAPVRPVAPGVIVRTVLAWALATGVPIVGVAMVAFGVLHGDTPRSNRTAWSVIFLCALALVVGAAVIVATAKSIAEPIGAVRQALARVEGGD